MAGAVFSAHQGMSGRFREATFSKVGLQIHSGRILGSILADFLRFVGFFEVRLGSIFDQNRQFFGAPNFNDFLVYFWEGSAAGADLIWETSARFLLSE